MQSLLEHLDGEFLYIKNRNPLSPPTCLQRGGRAPPVREYRIKSNNLILPLRFERATLAPQKCGGG